MKRNARTRWLSVMVLAGAIVAMGAGSARAADVTSSFAGKAVNGGTVTHEHRDGRHVLTLSPDFVVPGSPDPHWQVIDSRGNVYQLDRLKLKDDKVKTTITLPQYVPDVARVQMWCAWAETLLGEASFTRPVAMK